MKKLLFVGVYVCFSWFFLLSCTNQEDSKQIVTIDISEDIIIPKTYVVSKCNNSLIIDGLANETAWQNIQFTDDFVDIEGDKIPHFRTRVKMLWGQDNLYIYAELYEPHIWGDITERDQIIYLNNDFEVFIDPSCNTHNYGEFEINALGTEWDLLLDKPYAVGGNPIFNWDINNLQTAVNVFGTINDFSDVDSMWTVEMAIPLHVLRELKIPPKYLPVDGEIWRINFSRVEWDYEIVDNKYLRKKVDGKLLPEYNWVWSPHYEINMHQPDKWGFIQFSDAESQTDMSFEVDDKMYYQQVAYAAFRKVRFSKIEDLKNMTTNSTKHIELKISEDELITAIYTKTNFGFEITFENDGVSYCINEEGLLKISNE